MSGMRSARAGSTSVLLGLYLTRPSYSAVVAMKPSWVVMAGGSSLSVSPPQRNVSVPVAPAGFVVAVVPVCVAPGCVATGVHAATIVAAPAARNSARRLTVWVLILPFLPLETAGRVKPAPGFLRGAFPPNNALFL